MKRFFCTECKRIRRARQIPIITRDSDVVMNRYGICASHSYQSRASYLTSNNPTSASKTFANKIATPVVVKQGKR